MRTRLGGEISAMNPISYALQVGARHDFGMGQGLGLGPGLGPGVHPWKMPELLGGSENQLVQIGSLKVWVRVEEKGPGSFHVVPSREMAKSEVIRLGRSIKHEAEQIPSSHSGLIILDAGTLQGYADEEVTSAVERTFSKYRLPNIIGTTIVRSYKFYKLGKEPEVIMISNPNYKGDISIRKLNRILTFSRTRNLIPQKQPLGGDNSKIDMPNAANATIASR